MPAIPETTAIGSPNLSNLTASFNLLPKIKKKPIITNPKKLIKSEFEKISLFCSMEKFNYLKLNNLKFKLIN